MRVALIVVVVSGLLACIPTRKEEPSCETDERLCPLWPKTASRVRCACTCEVRVSATDTRSYSGPFDACLPPELNGSTASDAQRTALLASAPALHAQAIHAVCSSRVAGFLEEVVRLQLGADGPACLVQAAECTCAPSRVWSDSRVCDRPCKDIPCEERTCAGVLKKHAQLDHSACWCSRVHACGGEMPAASEPALCRAELASRGDDL